MTSEGTTSHMINNTRRISTVKMIINSCNLDRTQCMILDHWLYSIGGEIRIKVSPPRISIPVKLDRCGGHHRGSTHLMVLSETVVKQVPYSKR
ncbi:hypothetical protein ElyMa_004794700 [Elysia marginata]|uniref:Uncharacterized protein n=1 Tax=Elysia marginata TaxID=1093978 RepID=A0AAV4IN31_9GAST|nr:hypothetical protein ElyMa_004794700 [Elysia marginata]